MVDENKEVPELSYIDRLKKQHVSYCKQHEQAKVSVQQLVGAIVAIENLIKQHEQDELKKAEAKIQRRLDEQLKLDELSDMKMDMEIKQGELENGGTDHSQAE